MSNERTVSDNSSRQQNQLADLTKLTGELAHELKNPLSTCKVNLKLIAEELDALAASGEGLGHGFARARRKLGVVQQETDRLERILEGFLKYVGRPQVSLAEVDLNELVGDMVDFYMPQATSHSVTIRHHLSERPLVCRADSAMLKQVMLNLFINAQQAMAEGGELMVRTQKIGSSAQIQISDTGPGIPPDKIEHIFEPFFSSKHGGSGLGLATARRIVDAHNGRLTVASEPGKGTAFTIEIPLAG